MNGVNHLSGCLGHQVLFPSYGRLAGSTARFGGVQAQPSSRSARTFGGAVALSEDSRAAILSFLRGAA